MNTRQIYYTIIEQRRSQRLIPFVPFFIPNMWKQIHNDILPNYLKTFNDKIIWNLMPVKSKPYVATYYGTSLCSFCNQQDEIEFYLFFSCIKLQSVWNLFMFLMFQLTGYSLPSVSLNLCLFFDFSVLSAQHSHSQLIINGIAFLLSATKYCI